MSRPYPIEQVFFWIIAVNPEWIGFHESFFWMVLPGFPLV